MADQCKWTGKSGKEYIYNIYSIDTTWNDLAGNYIFAKKTNPNTWEPVYIGETESFKNRLPNHNELPCIRRNGGTHIHAHVNQDSQARLTEEQDLLVKYATPCNS